MSGLDKNDDMVKKSHVSLTSASVEKVLMDPGYVDASGTVRNSLMDVGIANVSVANELMDVRHETSYGVVSPQQTESVQDSSAEVFLMRPPQRAEIRKKQKEFDGFQSCAPAFAALPRLWESSSWKNQSRIARWSG